MNFVSACDVLLTLIMLHPYVRVFAQCWALCIARVGRTLKTHPHSYTVVCGLPSVTGVLPECTDCVLSISVTLALELTVRSMATDRTREPAAATADSDPPDLPAEIDDVIE